MNKTKKLFKNSSLQKKMISGGLACTLLFGGAIPAALAAEETTAVQTTVSQQQVGVVDLLVQKRLQSAASEISAISGKDFASVQKDLSSGLSIVEAANMSANALMNSMLPTFSQYIIEATHTLLSEDQIAQLQKEGQAKLVEALSTSGYVANNDVVSKVENNLTAKIDDVLKSSGYAASEDNAVELQNVVAKRFSTIIEDAVDASDLTLTDVLVQLELGSNLAEATGMDSADLSIQLQQLVNEDIDNAAANGINALTVEEAKADAAKLIEKLVTEKIWVASEQA
ncbi:hypothetical protein ACFQI7_16185 [Paenibacillus allorhizosphaerae]|uniref:Uncharacterized protein n=1 Tax=Paenibacillus allorhizosphaerae TaxID=2849866 RepID=A0ABN7TFG3_9BACL|nr:hypothetical protein [Paenibacillus allorhizosphaerae]CAG7630030.1 hypothetical protein PAECIP111802_01612 [Paenibacillus allorhizosphaerae]